MILTCAILKNHIKNFIKYSNEASKTPWEKTAKESWFL